MTSWDDIIPMSHCDVIQRVTSPFFFEKTVSLMGCDANGNLRGNKRGGEVHVREEFLPHHGRERISMHSLVTSVGVM